MLLAMAAFASSRPAGRAATVQPSIALRTE